MIADEIRKRDPEIVRHPTPPKVVEGLETIRTQAQAALTALNEGDIGTASGHLTALVAWMKGRERGL